MHEWFRKFGRISGKLRRPLHGRLGRPLAEKPQPTGGEPTWETEHTAETALDATGPTALAPTAMRAGPIASAQEQSAAEVEERDAMRQAEELRQQGNDEAALLQQNPRGAATAGPALAAARILVDKCHYDDAERILEEAQQQFPDEPLPFIEHARIAEAKRDWTTMADRYAAVRERFPENGWGYGGGAHALRELRRFDEADALLETVQLKLPNDAGAFLDYARVAEARGDWSGMAERYSVVRERFPDNWWGFAGGATALTNMGQMDQAEELLRQGQKRLPGVPALLIDYARLAERRNDWSEMVRRCKLLLERFPDNDWGYIAGARALREIGHNEEEEELLTEANRRFPNNEAIAIEHVRAAMRRGEWTEVLVRANNVRLRFPNTSWTYAAEAHALDCLGRPAEVISLLTEAMNWCPPHADVWGAYCWIAHNDRDWSRAERRWNAYRQQFPARPDGYRAGAVALRELGRFDDAEACVAAGLREFPADVDLWASHAFIASGRKDWPQAIQRWKAYVERFPDHAVGYVHAGIAFREANRFDESDLVTREGLARFPNHIELLGNYAWSAYNRHDWQEALQRWETYRSRFPQDALGHYQTMLVLQELGHLGKVEAISRNESPAAKIPSLARLMLEFESLGDNCEFGVVQRHFGAEPLGLLRFTAIPPRLLVAALDAKFEGVGSPENTILNVYKGEYLTADKRYHMAMHTFIKENGDDRERRFGLVCRRLRFLREKLIGDLVAADKIFVYGCRERLNDEEIRGLWNALRGYGENRLLFVREPDPKDQPGTIRDLGNGLVVGYIDHFSVDHPSFDVWLSLCEQTYDAVGQKGRVRIDELAS